jgi:hypothetical protein
VLLLWVSLSTASAQVVSTASVIGQVVDESGSVLPGVTVTAASPALQVRQITVVTDTKGGYRIVELPLGVYEVTFSLQGFQTMKLEGIRLTAGFVAKMDAVLKIASVRETVTVVGASPLVDVTSSATQTQFLKETLDTIPSSRNNVNSLMALTPGVRTNVDVGGSGTGSQATLQVLGQIGQSETYLEGVLMREEAGGIQGGYLNFLSFEEAQVQTFARSAEAAVSGIFVNTIVKSGSNDFHGSYYASKTGPLLQSNNIDAKLAKQGVTSGNPLIARWDLSGDLGGRVVRDKLWFYGTARRQETNSLVIGLVKPDGTPGDTPYAMTFLTGKVTYQLTPRQKLVGVYHHYKKETIAGGGVFIPWEAQYSQVLPGSTSKVEWTGVFGSSMVASLQAGYWGYLSNKGSLSDKVATYDIGTQMYTGESVYSKYPVPGNNHIYRPDFRGSISFFKRDFLGGNHELKAGGEYFLERRSQGAFLRTSADYYLVFNRSVPYQFVTMNNPTTPLEAVNYGGVYVQDNWSIGRRLTLNLGLRFDRYNMFIPAQSREAGTFAPAASFPRVQFNIWNALAPRLHFAYDVAGNGRTAVKGGWGRFNELRTAYNEPMSWDQNAFIRTTYTWHDLNGNRQYDPGEVNLDPNGLDFVSSSGGANRVVNSNEGQPKLDEFSLTLEHQLRVHWAVRVSGIYTRGFNNRRLAYVNRPYSVYNIPITKQDPGPDGIVGTVDDPGTTLTYWDYPANLRGFQYETQEVVNEPDYVNQWKSLELAAVKRLSSNWQFQGSFSVTRNNIQFPVPSQAPRTPGLTPNDEIFSQNRTWQWLGKATGSYQFGWGLLASAQFQQVSGQPYARQVLLTGGKQIPSLVVNVEPTGSRRMPTMNQLDLRVEKTLRLLGASKLAVRVEVFNALNSNVVLGLTTRSGSQFEVPTSIMPPRIGMVSASFVF